jgi:hypothetical protein
MVSIFRLPATLKPEDNQAELELEEVDGSR